MFKRAKPFFLIAETPLHAGSGSDLGVVDLPIQREKHTGFPKIEASGLKGSIREQFRLKEKKEEEKKKFVNLVFGPEEGGDYAGALGFTDARLLLFPVKSMKGVFAWVTCPQVLHKFKSELSDIANVENIPDVPKENTVPEGSSLIVSNNNIVLEEYTFPVAKDPICKKFAEFLAGAIFKNEALAYWKEKLKKDMVVLSNDDFTDFVKLSTEVITRTKIDDNTGTVAKGALFTEEYLPQESILYAFALASPLFCKNGEKGEFLSNFPDKKSEEDKVLAYFEKCPSIFQIGGNATIGKGIVRMQLWEENHG